MPSNAKQDLMAQFWNYNKTWRTSLIAAAGCAPDPFADWGATKGGLLARLAVACPAAAKKLAAAYIEAAVEAGTLRCELASLQGNVDAIE